MPAYPIVVKIGEGSNGVTLDELPLTRQIRSPWGY